MMGLLYHSMIGFFFTIIIMLNLKKGFRNYKFFREYFLVFISNGFPKFEEKKFKFKCIFYF